MGSVQTLEEATELRARSVAFILLAEALGPDGRLLVDPEGIEALRGALRAGRASAALARLDGVAPSDLEVEELAGLWVRWFDLGRVAPYEGSNVASNAGGVTPRLADVAGFYRALGMAVVDERPDHVLAQLEFMAVAVLAEAEAIESGSTEDEKSTARCARSFLRDHLGSWIDTWAVCSLARSVVRSGARLRYRSVKYGFGCSPSSGGRVTRSGSWVCVSPSPSCHTIAEAARR